MAHQKRGKELHITVNNVRLRYFDWGTDGKTPLVCLHGHTGQAHIWDEFAEAMSADYHVLALDQRGHGGSDWAEDGYERNRFVEDLAALVDELKIDSFVLAGLSMGGWNSLLYTAANPARVERIVMVDIGPEASQESKAMMGKRPPTPMEFDSIDSAVGMLRQANPWVTDDRLRLDVSDRLKQRQDGKWTWKADPKLFNTPLRDMTDPDLLNRYWQAIESIPCPILEVRGAASPLVSDAVLSEMKRRGQELLSVDVAEAGHVVTVDQPQRFIDATREFLSSS
ncbi:MAG: alpha/beta hydrolase [Pseudomonadales bacterium]|nr:alpha/beta hydrolase [Pseudomonadales bacterium]MDP7357321.1 alpha/beta hydrolase [Pseudomonadales bacterium]MDP7595930.1 alpha/beta hydrolase [Pseudomonadales bacterium]HJN49283.1 alpha/beta hydrolase [Pseudomonadales bacterium]